jgi:hypothetical protein
MRTLKEFQGGAAVHAWEARVIESSRNDVVLAALLINSLNVVFVM